MNVSLIIDPTKNICKNRPAPIEYYSHLIKIDDLEHFIDNPHMNDDEKKRHFLKIACEYNKLKFIKYLINDIENTTLFDKIFSSNQQKIGNKLITYDLLALATQNRNIEMFKYLIDNTDFNANHIGINNSHPIKGNNLLSCASYHKNINLVRYMVETLKLSLNASTNHTKPLVVACSMPNNEIVVKYLINKSIEQKIKYDYCDDKILKGNSLYANKLSRLFKLFDLIDLI